MIFEYWQKGLIDNMNQLKSQEKLNDETHKLYSFLKSHQNFDIRNLYCESGFMLPLDKGIDKIASHSFVYNEENKDSYLLVWSKNTLELISLHQKTKLYNFNPGKDSTIHSATYLYELDILVVLYNGHNFRAVKASTN